MMVLFLTLNLTALVICTRLDQFAELYARKVGVSACVLNKTLWGDFYLDGKTKTVRKGAQVSCNYSFIDSN